MAFKSSTLSPANELNISSENKAISKEETIANILYELPHFSFNEIKALVEGFQNNIIEDHKKLKLVLEQQPLNFKQEEKNYEKMFSEAKKDKNPLTIIDFLRFIDKKNNSKDYEIPPFKKHSKPSYISKRLKRLGKMRRQSILPEELPPTHQKPPVFGFYFDKSKNSNQKTQKRYFQLYDDETLEYTTREPTPIEEDQNSNGNKSETITEIIFCEIFQKWLIISTPKANYILTTSVEKKLRELHTLLNKIIKNRSEQEINSFVEQEEETINFLIWAKFSEKINQKFVLELWSSFNPNRSFQNGELNLTDKLIVTPIDFSSFTKIQCDLSQGEIVCDGFIILLDNTNIPMQAQNLFNYSKIPEENLHIHQDNIIKTLWSDYELSLIPPGRSYGKDKNFLKVWNSNLILSKDSATLNLIKDSINFFCDFVKDPKTQETTQINTPRLIANSNAVSPIDLFTNIIDSPIMLTCIKNEIPVGKVVETILKEIKSSISTYTLNDNDLLGNVNNSFEKVKILILCFSGVNRCILEPYTKFLDACAQKKNKHIIIIVTGRNTDKDEYFPKKEILQWEIENYLPTFIWKSKYGTNLSLLAWEETPNQNQKEFLKKIFSEQNIDGNYFEYAKEIYLNKQHKIEGSQPKQLVILEKHISKKDIPIDFSIKIEEHPQKRFHEVYDNQYNKRYKLCPQDPIKIELTTTGIKVILTIERRLPIGSLNLYSYELHFKKEDHQLFSVAKQISQLPFPCLYLTLSQVKVDNN